MTVLPEQAVFETKGIQRKLSSPILREDSSSIRNSTRKAFETTETQDPEDSPPYATVVDNDSKLESSAQAEEYVTVANKSPKPRKRAQNTVDSPNHLQPTLNTESIKKKRKCFSIRWLILFCFGMILLFGATYIFLVKKR